MQTKIENLINSMTLLGIVGAKVSYKKRPSELELAEAYTFLIKIQHEYHKLVRMRAQMPEGMWARCKQFGIKNDATIKWVTLVKHFKQIWKQRPRHLGGKNETLKDSDQ